MSGRNEANRPGPAEILYLFLESEGAFGIDRLPSPPVEAEESRARGSLEELARTVRACRACTLCRHRRNTVFGDGDPCADLLFVGEAPGRDEDLTGVPFVGRAGQLLDRMIRAMGRDRQQVYIANVLKCRPPDNRTPTLEEIACCRKFLEEQIRAISPRVIVALGAPAARTLLDRREGIHALRGRVHAYPLDPGIPVVPTFHPAYLLRNESEKGKAWEDLKTVMKLLRR